jgi:hypothetical protein
MKIRVKKKVIKEPASELISEHKNLVKVLKSGSKEERMEEGKKQDNELKEYKKEAKK